MTDIYKKKTVSRNEFKGYCQSLISHISLGKISRESGCYKIAGLMFRPEVSQDSLMEDICTVAGELELPDEHVSDVTAGWAELKELVSKL